LAVTALVQAGAHPDVSDGEWWTSLLVGTLTGDEAAMTELRVGEVKSPVVKGGGGVRGVRQAQPRVAAQAPQ
jgi:hypothetical protein